jgi:hypothetical protein
LNCNGRWCTGNISTTPSPNPLATAASCGGGNVGDGKCADSTLCCSKWGWW